MARVLLVMPVLLAAALAVLFAVRIRHERRVDGVWRALQRSGEEVRFYPEMVDGLPAPAQRYLLHTLEPGARLATSVEITLSGSIRLSRDADPVPMASHEILSAGRGYVWRARAGRAPIRIRGYDLLSDGVAEMRWWLWGVIPIIWSTGEDIRRSAAGRLAGEAVLLPSALLPVQGARWSALDDSTATVIVPGPDGEVELTIEVGAGGNLQRVRLSRWNSDPKNGALGYLPFVSEEFADERTFDRYTIPTRFRSGWRLGALDEFAFFFARIERMEFH